MVPASATSGVGAPPRRSLEAVLMATSRAVRQAYDHCLAGVALKPSEAFLLTHVHRHGPMIQTQLAEWLGIGRAATGALIDGLEARGLVERSADPADRRVWLVVATERSGPLVEEIAALDAALHRELWVGIDRFERRQLVRVLMRLEANLAAIVNDSA